MTAQERRAEALSRAANPLGSFTNYPAIFQGFATMGIPEQDIHPRENVFTFQAWKALGRHVRKGQHGVRVLTYIVTDDRRAETQDGDKPTEQPKRRQHSRPWTTTVFHVSQTDPDTMPSAVSA